MLVADDETKGFLSLSVREDLWSVHERSALLAFDFCSTRVDDDVDEAVVER